MRYNFDETNQLNANLTVEHVLPVHWEKHRPLPDGSSPTSEEIWQASIAIEENNTRIGQIVRRNRLRHTFGNLTLLTRPLNSSVSNGPYNRKRTALEEHSLLVLNREITKQTSWGEEQIEERGKGLFGVAKILWPYPS